MFNPVFTLTVSPARKEWSGMKLAPLPSESARILPVCAPLFDPVTVTGPIAAGATPRNVIWVCGAATRAPGTGNTLTDEAEAKDADGEPAAMPKPAAITTADRRKRDSNRIMPTLTPGFGPRLRCDWPCNLGSGRRNDAGAAH